MALDAQSIRKEFPLLSQQMRGKPLVYLDNAATTQKPASVLRALTQFYETSNANIHRGVYELAERATEQYEHTRLRVSRFINAPDARGVIFTRGTTEAINLVAYAWARKNLKAGDEILLTDFEHHANIVPWYLIAREKGVTLKSVPIKENATFNMEAFRQMLNPNVKLVSVTAMSNVLGTILPVNEITRLAHENGSLVLIDGAQSAPHLPTDVREIGCDFFCFSAHKMLGPTGVGVLWARPELLEEMDPFLGGGEMINTVSFTEITWADIPLKFEAGTSNFADVAAFSTALDYLENIGMAAIREHEKKLTRYALEQLSGMPELIVYGPRNSELQGGAISFNHKVVHAHDVGTILGEEGIAIRVGHHCAQPMMKALGVGSTARASFYIYNTEADVDALVRALAKVDQVFGLTGAKRP